MESVLQKSPQIAHQGQRLRNQKQEAFARAVAALTPLESAYREAGYGGDPRWHPYNASKLAGKAHIKARIDELRVEFEKYSAIHTDYIRHLLLRMLEANPVDLYEIDPSDPTGKRLRLRSIVELPRHLSAVARIKVDPETGAPTEIILANRHEAAGILLRSLPGGQLQRHELTLEQLVGDSMHVREGEARDAARVPAALPSATAQTTTRRF
jgi:hypothetical protein